ncbi:MAG: MFS transporter [Chloroflexota bacterium]|nr:MFS transporter [Chloroflexota bacterium]MDE2883767.1 MFS transporter [Chloroflexota bacterium]
MAVLTPRGKPFYGWTVVSVLGVFGAVGVGLAGPNFALFIVPVSEELGWKSSTFGWAFFLRFLMVLAAGPLIGRLIDLRGPRLPVVGALLVAGGAVLWLSRIAAAWELMAAFMLIGLVGMGRANDLQAGASIAKWFVRRRGLAMGIALGGTPLGVAVYYPLTQLLIDNAGWRGALVWLAVSGIAVAVPLSLLLRRQPEDVGLLPDGDAPSSGASSGASGAPLRAAPSEERSLTRREAMRTGRFWLMLGGFTAMTYGVSTLAIFRVPHFVERGLDPGLVAIAISVDAVIAVVASVLLGRVLDRAPVRTVLLGGIAIGALCAVGLLVAGSVFWLFAANIFYALGFQSTHVAQSVMWANQFGRRHQGDLRGFTIPVTVGVGAVAFPVTGYLRDAADTYTPAWFVAIGALAVAGVLLMAVRPVHPHPPLRGGLSPGER